MPGYINFPSWIHPEIISGLPMRWYGLMYILSFMTAWILFRIQIKRRALNYSKDQTSGFFIAGIIGLLIGARIFYVLFYERSGLYLRMPWLAILPFDEKWRFTGYSGFSFHGGFIGALIGTIIYSKRHKLEWLAMADITVIAVPLGYTFGRLGNFFNGELWGKVTALPFGIIFPNADRFPVSETWVREIMVKIGLTAQTTMINLPRHPSQLYEALFEGVILWAFLWFIVKPKIPWKGFATGAWMIGYGFVRFFIEYVREPDEQLGYIVSLTNSNASTHYFSSFWNFSMGQLLCFLMILAGIATILVTKRFRQSEVITNKIPENKIRYDKKKGRSKKTKRH